MNRLFTLILLTATLAAAGCASKASLDAAYDASLQRWHGATRAELEAGWGQPKTVSTANGDTLLTWVVRNDVDRTSPNSTPIIVPNLSNTSAATTKLQAVIPAGPTSAVVPITCTTHFVVKDGRVASWTFEGLGCGAPY